jgi:hypothetical protein
MMQLQNSPGPMGKLLAIASGVALLVLGLMFSLVLLVVVLVVGFITLAYFWWKTRALRKVMREQAATQGREHGPIIEGEAVVIEEAGGAPLQVEITTPDEKASSVR